MKQIGTILPTLTSMTIADECQQRDIANKRQAAIKHGLDRFLEVGTGIETRYYDGLTKYAVIGRDLQPKWFAVRADGDYPIKDREET